MPDFHVVALKYRLEPSDHVSYAQPPPLIFENEAARFQLENNQLRCEMKVHAATSDQARSLIDPTFCQTGASQTKSGPTESMSQVCCFYLWQPFRAFLRCELKVIRDLLCKFALPVLSAVSRNAQNWQHHLVVFRNCHVTLSICNTRSRGVQPRLLVRAN
jgi:hypothetical protein